jgi:hypothetical protein
MRTASAPAARRRERGEQLVRIAVDGPSRRDELQVAHLEQVDAAAKGRGQRGSGDVRDDPRAVRAQVAGQPGVELVGDAVRRVVPGEDDDAGRQPGRERQAVELVDLVPLEPRRGQVVQRSPAAIPQVGDVDPVGARDANGEELDALRGDEAPEDGARFPTQRAAERDTGTESRDHPRHPEALPARVEVHLLARAERHREDGRGRQHDDLARARAPLGGRGTRPCRRVRRHHASFNVAYHTRSATATSRSPSRDIRR